MQITHTIDQTRALAGGELAFVPTMGALHEGHLSLIRHAKQLAPRVAVSIFVNPNQFTPDEDFAEYPRPLQRDLSLCEAEGVDFAFVPSVDEIYPPDAFDVVIDVPDLATHLEAQYRPGHFVGVCQIVAKLLAIVQPRVVCFGRKDYQQLKVIEAMIRGLCLPVRVEACPTIREPDGLALSSRNRYLDAEQRRHALCLHKALEEAQQLIEQEGEVDPAAVEAAMAQQMQAHHMQVDYAVVRDARTLTPVDLINPRLEPVVCLVAGRLGNVRLIDNRVMSGA